MPTQSVKLTLCSKSRLQQTLNRFCYRSLTVDRDDQSCCACEFPLLVSLLCIFGSCVFRVSSSSSSAFYRSFWLGFGLVWASIAATTCYIQPSSHFNVASAGSPLNSIFSLHLLSFFGALPLFCSSVEINNRID